MKPYVLSCCSTADLSKEHFERRNINYICFHFSLDGVEYKDDLGQSIPFDEFYKRMSEGSETQTSQVNVAEFVEYFEPFLKEGKDIIHLCLSSGITGVYNSASLAKQELQEKYPDRKIYIVDSLGASSGYGLIMETLADLRDGGANIDELYKWVEEHKLNLHHWFYSTDLSYYVKGGRISKASGWFGTMLHICPLLNMDDLGRLIPRFKCRGKNAVQNKLIQMMEECADDGLNYSGKCYISNAGCEDEARKIAQIIENKFPKLNGKVVINSVGTTIGSHTGPGTLALFFWGKKRER